MHEMLLLLDKQCDANESGPLYTKRTDFTSQDLVKLGSGIGCYNGRIALKFDRPIGSATAEASVKSQSDWKSLNPNLAASRLCEILGLDVRPLSE